ncbi:uncharacterized protein MONOS_957 [Monocercomonoides exilis]|uniref:uncharacterized protein n=1 Tax=Monocercomonoides exilis TaxID=2049356 RepID=UPI003559E319|nr:hypothetical protein MONOS_957 [Monocercomonoides exilis]|eukprot:MONOS_957.1-p1 / transcript=MONOS_957.1 / gene=MONOS_957 / organism=Monocercomonoides_exilis_PA203 / gene_product=unspecified product / transcript_product=unspecified product / location=Mono_scaffold00016:36804-42506(+) / protein_length=1880 / sequence_SO=supercontig / SO=protein_coding / is_pseudo=false
MTGAFQHGCLSFFGYLDFSISWSSDIFVMVMLIIVELISLLSICGLFLLPVIGRKNLRLHREMSRIIVLGCSLCSTLFAIPIINVECGHFLCYLGGEHSSPLISIDCQGSAHSVFIIIGSITGVLHVGMCFFFRLFIFNYNFHHLPEATFSTQSGFFSALSTLLPQVAVVVSLCLSTVPYAAPAICLAIFLLLTLIIVFYQPFFHKRGNSLYAAAFAFPVPFFVMSMVCTAIFPSAADISEGRRAPLSDSQWNLYAYSCWIGFAVLALAFSILMYFLASVRAKKLWVVGEGEEIPELPVKHKQELQRAIEVQTHVPSSLQMPQPILHPAQPSSPFMSSLPSTPTSLSQRGTPLRLTNLGVTPSNEPLPIHVPQSLGPGSNNTSNGKPFSVSQNHLLPHSNYSPSIQSSEQEKGKKPLKPARVVKKWRSSFACERAIRFLSLRSLRCEHQYITLAGQVLNYGTTKFPDSCSIWIESALFHRYFSHNFMKGVEALRVSKQCIPSIVQRWLIHVVTTEMEKDGGRHRSTWSSVDSSSSGNQSTSAFRTGMTKATKSYESAKYLLNQLFIMLMKDNIDVNRSIRLLDLIVEHDMTANDEFTALLAVYPNSTQLLRAYGVHLRDIERDDETAMSLFSIAQQIEDDLTTISSMSQETGSIAASQMGVPGSGREFNFERASYISTDSRRSASHPDTYASKKKQITKKKRKKFRQGRSGANAAAALKLFQDKKNLLPYFYPVMFICVITITAGLVIAFVESWSAFSLSVNTVSTLDSVSKSQMNLYEEMLFSKYFHSQLIYFPTHGMPDGTEFIPSIQKLEGLIGSRRGVLVEHMKTAYKLAANAEERSMWEVKSINVTFSSTVGDQVTGMWSVKCNLIDACATAANSGWDLQQYDVTGETPPLSTGYYFISANVPIAMMETMKALAIVTIQNVEKKAQESVFITLVLGIVITIVDIAGLLIQYVLTIRKLKKERHSIVYDFLTAPKNKILKLKMRLEEADKDHEDDALRWDQRMRQSRSRDLFDTTTDSTARSKRNRDDADDLSEMRSHPQLSQINEEKSDGIESPEHSQSMIDDSQVDVSFQKVLKTVGIDLSDQPGPKFRTISSTDEATEQQREPVDPMDRAPSAASFDAQTNQGYQRNAVSSMYQTRSSITSFGNDYSALKVSPTTSATTFASAYGNVPNMKTAPAPTPSPFQSALFQQTQQQVGQLQMIPHPNDPTGQAALMMQAQSQQADSQSPSLIPSLYSVLTQNGSIANQMPGMPLSDDRERYLYEEQKSEKTHKHHHGKHQQSKKHRSEKDGEQDAMQYLTTSMPSSPLAPGSSNAGPELSNSAGGDKNDLEKERLAQEEANEENEMKLEAMEEQDKLADLEEKVKKNNSFIPCSFYFRVVVGLIFIITFSIVFYSISSVAITSVSKPNGAIYLASFRTVIVELIALLSMSIVTPYYTMPDNAKDMIHTTATCPLWDGLNHLSNNLTEIQRLMKRTETFFSLLHQKVKEGGGKNTGGAITGDDMIDSLDTPRTYVVDSEINKLMLDSAECFPVESQADCNNKTRLYGMSGNFSGLDGLINTFLSSSIVIASDRNPNILLANNSHIQVINSLTMNDLKGGLLKYSQILSNEQDISINAYNSLLIAFFVLNIGAIALSFFGCFLQTRDQLFNIAKKTVKILDLDPRNDQTLHMMEWSEQHMSDVPRLDNAHQQCCNYALDLLDSVEKIEIDVQQIKSVSHGATTSDVEERKAKHMIELKQKLRSFVVAFFLSFSDEEVMMRRFSVSHKHRKKHFSEHINQVRKICKFVISAAREGVSSQSVVENTGMWLSDHVAKTDKELGTILMGKAPPSELERDVSLDVIPEESIFPMSFINFLQSDDASLVDRNLYESFCHTFHLK